MLNANAALNYATLKTGTNKSELDTTSLEALPLVFTAQKLPVLPFKNERTNHHPAVVGTSDLYLILLLPLA